LAEFKQFLRIPLSERILEESSRRAQLLPIYKRSHRGFQANQVGCIGEVVTELLLKKMGMPVKTVYRTSHDLEVNGKWTEVKSKDRAVSPRSTDECSVALYNMAVQHPDLYVFLSLQHKNSPKDSVDIMRFHTAWVVGYATAEDLKEKGEFRAAGSVEPNGMRFFTDSRNISIENLRPIRQLPSEDW